MYLQNESKLEQVQLQFPSDHLFLSDALDIFDVSTHSMYMYCTCTCRFIRIWTVSYFPTCTCNIIFVYSTCTCLLFSMVNSIKINPFKVLLMDSVIMNLVSVIWSYCQSLPGQSLHLLIDPLSTCWSYCQSLPGQSLHLLIDPLSTCWSYCQSLPGQSLHLLIDPLSPCTYKRNLVPLIWSYCQSLTDKAY